MKSLLGIVWTALFFWGLSGLYMTLTTQPPFWAQFLVELPLGIWGVWTYTLLDSKKEKTDEHDKEPKLDARADG